MVDLLTSAKALLVSEYFTGKKGVVCTKLVKKSRTYQSMLDKRKFKNKEAVKWAFSRGFLSNDPHERQWVMDWDKDIYVNGWISPDVDLLEPEILWALLKDAISTHKGRSIISSAAWENLGINPLGNRFHTDKDYQKQWTVLARLASFDYIWFESCGNVWNIEPKNFETH
jgi:hypothetical protein